MNSADLNARYASLASSTQPVDLAFFADDGLALNGIDLRVTGGDNYNLAQRWSGAIHTSHPDIDGIFYASRHHNGLYCVAIFERARDKVTFNRPVWGVFGDSASRDLFGQTAALLRRFHVQIHP